MTKRSGRNRSSRVRAVKGIGIGKYLSFLALISFVVWLTVSRSGSTKPFEEVSQAVQECVEDEDLELKDSQAFKKYYGLNSADYEGVLLYTSDFTMSAKEVLLVKVKNDVQAKEVKSAIEDRLESRKSSFEGYVPEQVQLLEQAEYEVRENYIFLAVTPEAEIYRQVFERSL
ncbi:MAG: DUF4358 domain-containing protein [Schaedlerella sp.]|nr:DUF4358 domain-containing protein [Schaedlerella sp.]